MLLKLQNSSFQLTQSAFAFSDDVLIPDFLMARLAVEPGSEHNGINVSSRSVEARRIRRREKLDLMQN